MKSINEAAKKTPVEIYYSLISACIRDNLPMEELISSTNYYRNVESVFMYKQVNEEVQIMLYKLGIHEKLVKDVKRYNTLRVKEKVEEEETVYWKLLLLYALIRNNLKLRDIVSEHRAVFIALLDNDKSRYKYYVAADILAEIYKNNRKLIISDNGELRQICAIVGRVIQQSPDMDLRCCKMVNLLGIFTKTGNRRIVENYQIILKSIFSREKLQKLTEIMNNRRNNMKEQREQENTENNKEHFRNIFQILIYDIMSSLGQKKVLQTFQRPNNTTINSILLGIGNRNWKLKSKVFSCINFNEEMPDRLPIQFMRLILYDLNIMCESIKTHSSELSKEVKIYISNMIKILDTIDSMFKYIDRRKGITSEESE